MRQPGKVAPFITLPLLVARPPHDSADPIELVPAPRPQSANVRRPYVVGRLREEDVAHKRPAKCDLAAGGTRHHRQQLAAINGLIPRRLRRNIPMLHIGIRQGRLNQAEPKCPLPSTGLAGPSGVRPAFHAVAP
jgi:hypothetical protein